MNWPSPVRTFVGFPGPPTHHYECTYIFMRNLFKERSTSVYKNIRNFQYYTRLDKKLLQISYPVLFAWLFHDLAYAKGHNLRIPQFWHHA